MSTFKIEPFAFYANSFKVIVYEVLPFIRARLHIVFYNEDNVVLSNQYLDLQGEDYENWSNDDQYLIDYVTTKFNLIVLPPVVEP